MGTWPVEIHRRGPAATKPHYEPRGSGGGGGDWDRSGVHHLTVAAASRPRHKPSLAGGGADWRIPLRIGPALDRGGFSPARAPVTDGAERLGDSFRGPVRCAPPDGSPPLPGPVISPRGPGESGLAYPLENRASVGPPAGSRRLGRRHRRGGAG